MTVAAPLPILFFDGACGLCDRTVQWMARRDRHGVLRYAPLQGETYARLSFAERPTDLSTVVLLDRDGLWMRSDAVLRALAAMGGPWANVARAGWLIPRPIRETLYRFIARRRLLWFGTVDSCSLADTGYQSRLLP